jgi:hypothetical protein
VASALEVSVVTLMSDPGSSGAYGTAQTLDVPTIKAMQARQQIWEQLFGRVLRFFGAGSKAGVKWPKMEQEATYRQVQAISLAYEAGALWEDEYREAILDELDVVPMHKNISPAAQAKVDGLDPNTGNGTNDPGNSNDTPASSGQGQSGAVGKMSNSDNSLRNMDNQPTA